MKPLLEKFFKEKTDKLFFQLFRYFIVGGTAFVVDYGLLLIMTELLYFNYLISASISFSIGSVLNYYISVHWVFKSRNLDNKKLEFTI